MIVERYSILDPVTKQPSGDFLRVDGVDLGSFRDLVDAEIRRAKLEYPENPAFYMRPMWFTGSPFGAEIMELAKAVRPNFGGEVPTGPATMGGRT